MKRDIYKKLVEWKNSDNRKPLILNGARQVGKTYILREFAQKEYEKYAYFSLDRDQRAAAIFNGGGTANDILLSLSAISNIDITPENTIVILDEIQDCPKALETLKFFCEDAPDIHVVVAGSLLGVSLHDGVSYPVGKVDELRLYPMTFLEFLDAMGKEKLAQTIREGNWNVTNLLHDEYISLLRQYYYVGGMPAVVFAYVQQKGLQEVRNIQRQILSDYRRDFSKHAPAREVPRINMVWDSIPSQLAKENKKFIYGAMKKSARASDFELSIQWLIDSGLVYKVTRVRSPKMPLKFYEDFGTFKLFMLDVGLMGAMTDTPAGDILVGNQVFCEYKGAFSELYILTQLIAQEFPVYYHSVDNSTIEIDFITQIGSRVVPIEVKAEVNVKSKSLRTFISNNPTLRGLRFSMLPYKEQEWIVNLPLYACCCLGNFNS
ncbi:MAG: ATP-binding protein [Prevotella sp.]|jgi:predicted AAA+ superfamily ATPase|nr:ATP-binding protein [Prevotella sp.]MCH4183666.1 ATP-binding protein [Prevotella sp.]MCH4213166.1 ATP-binding protein [Prevotella sp.]MCH4242534.1 ATP-binding protein [Prevotella sp.]MCI1742209.1 ATP-binding protein [Prevotella sp.]